MVIDEKVIVGVVIVLVMGFEKMIGLLVVVPVIEVVEAGAVSIVVVVVGAVGVAV